MELLKGECDWTVFLAQWEPLWTFTSGLYIFGLTVEPSNSLKKENATFQNRAGSAWCIVVVQMLYVLENLRILKSLN